MPEIEFHTNWYCPECKLEAQSTQRGMPLHSCPQLQGVMAPMVKQGVKARLKVNFREDFVKKDLVTTDANGRVVMSITTQRDDGEDLLVHSPCAVASLKDIQEG